MDEVGEQDAKAVMAKKLQEHLSNLDQVEQALKVDPNHEELLKLKADLTELIVLVSKQMLQFKTAATSSSETNEQPSADKRNIAPASSDIKGLLSNPNLPSFFYKKWIPKFTEQGSKPSTSSTTTTVTEASTKDTEEIPENEAAEKRKRIRKPREPGVPRKRAELTPEQKRNVNESPSGTEPEIKPGDVQNPSEVLPIAVPVDADKDKNVDVDFKQPMSVKDDSKPSSSQGVKRRLDNDNSQLIVAYDSAGNRFTMSDYLNNKIEDTKLKNFFKKKCKKLNQQCINDHLIYQGLEPKMFNRNRNRGVKAREKALKYGRRR